MSLDPVKNFAKVTVSTGYDASATSIVLSSGHGAKLPAPGTDGAFNLVWYNATDYNDPTDDPNVEIVRVTARSTDTLTVTRGQEGISASTKNTGSKTYKMILPLTKKSYDEIAPLASPTFSGTVTVPDVIVSGASKKIKGASTNVPDIGTTTLAEKLGNIYLGAAKDLYPANDIYGLWARKVDWGFTPDEHWKQNADELSWTGYASYTGFVTPSFTTTTLSTFQMAHNAGSKRIFRYRAAATGAEIYLRARMAITFQFTGGLMVDDGSGNADGNGADNFYRVYATQSTLGGAVTIVEQYRTGGGAVTTNVGPTMPYGEFYGIGLRCVLGTPWTSWTANPFTFGESQQPTQFTGGTAPMSWTPARVGLYCETSAIDHGRRAIYDWYDEATS